MDPQPEKRPHTLTEQEPDIVTIIQDLSKLSRKEQYMKINYYSLFGSYVHKNIDNLKQIIPSVVDYEYAYQFICGFNSAAVTFEHLEYIFSIYSWGLDGTDPYFSFKTLLGADLNVVIITRILFDMMIHAAKKNYQIWIKNKFNNMCRYF
jgi:hypothetical protein